MILRNTPDIVFCQAQVNPEIKTSSKWSASKVFKDGKANMRVKGTSSNQPNQSHKADQDMGIYFRHRCFNKALT